MVNSKVMFGLETTKKREKKIKKMKMFFFYVVLSCQDVKYS